MKKLMRYGLMPGGVSAWASEDKMSNTWWLIRYSMHDPIEFGSNSRCSEKVTKI